MQWRKYTKMELMGRWSDTALLDVYLSKGGLRDLVILAERYDNASASVTNAFAHYAQQLCSQFLLVPERTLFMEMYVDTGIQTIDSLRLAACDLIPNANRVADVAWRPLSPEMRRTIGRALLSRFGLTPSYRFSGDRLNPGS